MKFDKKKFEKAGTIFGKYAMMITGKSLYGSDSGKKHSTDGQGEGSCGSKGGRRGSGQGTGCHSGKSA